MVVSVLFSTVSMVYTNDNFNGMATYLAVAKRNFDWN